ncbi:GNAT family N-acetyltransferase [Vaginisenegalia massiliensis]|uniref:GNAT family N-acetyltransferase n=1 Tax=Vaginisenegalia massiliensis TaxID=2058294 RepID=UPI000F524B19|nr:N-acetyltransferase [Vaginisenegalia massiliensis]
MELMNARGEHYGAIDQLVRQAFSLSHYGYQGEAELVKRIRVLADFDPMGEWIVSHEGQIIAHGLLSPCKLVAAEQRIVGLVLAPLAVLPGFQGQGLGTRLANKLIEQAAIAQQYPFISVLGQPSFYQRLGFVPASHYNIQAPFDVPEDYYLIYPLHSEVLATQGGVIHYSSAFNL